MTKVVAKFLKNILNIISATVPSLIFPMQCVICKVSGKYLCDVCESKLELNNSNNKVGSKNNFGKINEWMYAKYKYKNQNLKKIEYKIKYGHHPKLAEIMGEYSYNFIYENIINKNNLNLENTYLVPIPISKNRLTERGYNQTEYIANGIINKFLEKNEIQKDGFNLKLLDILDRKNTSKLKDVYGIDNRSEEMKTSMSINESKLSNLGGGEAAALSENNLKSRDNIFILIDDITTTGSTFYEARRALAEYGIIEKNIYAYALAH